MPLASALISPLGSALAALLLGSALVALLVGAAAPLSAQEAPARAAVVSSADPAFGAGARASHRLLGHIYEFSGAPGVSAAVTIDGRLVWTGVAGWADVEAGARVTPASRFRLASVTKLYTATLALRLWEEGLLDLDADVRRYVPSWPDHDGAVITPRLLASHTAGINHYRSGPSDPAARQRHYEDIFEALVFFADAPLLQPPGEAYSYSSYGYALLNAVMTAASGRTLGDGFDFFLFRPLGLGETGVEDVRDLPPNAVTLYDVDIDGVATTTRINDQSFVWGASGMRATARDLARFGSAFLTASLVSEGTRDMALTPMLLANGEPAGIERFDVGFGWRLGLDWDGRPVTHHAGQTPGARTVILGYPEGRAAVALLLNARWTSRIETTAELLAAPFAETEGVDDADCPTGVWRLEGEFEGDPEIGEIRIGPQAGLCIGSYASDGALIGMWLEDRPDLRHDFPLTRVARRGDAHVFAMANQWGLAQLRVTLVEDGLHASGDVAGRTFSLEGSRVE